MTHPDFIAVEASQTARVEADRADILVTVAGLSLFSGEMALQKAREVAELVVQLKSAGIEEKQFRIESIRVETQSGTFSKTSSAYYNLRIENVPTTKVADAVGAIGSARNATLTNIQWRFPDENPLRDELRHGCLQTALERARSIALSLGVRLLGVFEMEESWQGTQEESNPAPGGGMFGRSRAKRVPVSEDELGMAVSHAEMVRIELNFKFRVSEFEQK
jgi:uncharacterized protein YggE